MLGVTGASNFGTQKLRCRALDRPGRFFHFSLASAFSSSNDLLYSHLTRSGCMLAQGGLQFRENLGKVCIAYTCSFGAKFANAVTKAAGEHRVVCHTMCGIVHTDFPVERSRRQVASIPYSRFGYNA